jgi:hypothetical protein
MRFVILYTNQEVFDILKSDPSAVFHSNGNTTLYPLRVTSKALEVFYEGGCVDDYPLTDLLSAARRDFIRDNDPNIQKIRFEE